jgi:hypothetical protein
VERAFKASIPKDRDWAKSGSALSLQKAIDSEFKRDSHRWKYDEEQLLSEISLRPKALDEWKKIVGFREKVPPARQQYEGVSNGRQILIHWQEILDKVNGGYDPEINSTLKPHQREAKEATKLINREAANIVKYI